MAPGDQRRTRRRRAAGGLRVTVVDGQGRSVAAAALSGWLERVAPAPARGTVTVALAADARVRALNRTYRKKDYATDVLSFPAGPSPAGTSHLAPRTHRTRRTHRTHRTYRTRRTLHLGDIVIATGVARRQAREAGHSEQTELKILALHGLLHLLGYDHETDGGTMARVERRLRRLGNLHEGLIERARA